MTWSYDIANLSSVSSSTAPMTRVRLMVGDTDPMMQLLSDEEIAYSIAFSTAPNYAAANLADMLGARFAFQVNTQNSELRISAAARSKAYFALADRLRKNGPGPLPGGDNNGGVLAEGYFGGTSRSQNEALRSDSDNVAADVRVGQDDFRVSDPSDYFKA